VARDELNAIGVLKRREIEARVLGPLIEELSREFDRERVLEILRKVIVRIAVTQGRELAARMDGCSPLHLAESLDDWRKDDALQLEVLEQTDERLSFNVTRCRYAELYQALGIPELGEILSCGRDFALGHGFNPRLKLTRTQTILGGATHCDFRYAMEEDARGRERAKGLLFEDE
jgi:hypothetical protein